jgi:hypothetical protein
MIAYNLARDPITKVSSPAMGDLSDRGHKITGLGARRREFSPSE